MANEFFTSGTSFIPANAVKAHAHNSKFAAVETGFDLVAGRINDIETDGVDKEDRVTALEEGEIHRVALMTFTPDSNATTITEDDAYFNGMVLLPSTKYILRALQVFSSTGDTRVKQFFITDEAVAFSEITYEWRDDNSDHGGRSGNLFSGVNTSEALTPNTERKYTFTGMVETTSTAPTVRLKFAQAVTNAAPLVRVAGFVEFTEVK